MWAEVGEVVVTSTHVAEEQLAVQRDKRARICPAARALPYDGDAALFINLQDECLAFALLEGGEHDALVGGVRGDP